MDKKYIVLFSPDFKYKIDSFNLYITENYVKRTIGRYILRIEKPLAPKTIIRFIDRMISSFLLSDNRPRIFVNQNQIN